MASFFGAAADSGAVAKILAIRGRLGIEIFEGGVNHG